jgi:hypothetical protein
LDYLQVGEARAMLGGGLLPLKAPADAHAAPADGAATGGGGGGGGAHHRKAAAADGGERGPGAGGGAGDATGPGPPAE